MKKSLLSFLFLLSSVPMLAGDGDEFVTIKGGFLFARTGNAQFGYERNLSYDATAEFFGEVGQKFLPSDQPRDYYWASGLGYKQVAKRYKNSLLRWTSEVHGGAHLKKFFLGFGVGLEYSYVFPNGVQFVVQQKNQVNFLTSSTFKHGLLVGLKFPL